MKTLLTACVAIAVLLAVSACASAQTLTNPRWIQFDAPDNSITTSYHVDYIQQGATAPTASVDLLASAGLVGTGTITVVFSLAVDSSGLLVGLPIGPTFTAVVKPINSVGTGPASLPSNPFVLVPALAIPRGVGNVKMGKG